MNNFNDILKLDYCTICQQKDHLDSVCPNKCTICKGKHITSLHRCSICNVIGADHLTFYCPLKCPCNGFHTRQEHRCFYCSVRNPFHNDNECSMRFLTRRI